MTGDRYAVGDRPTDSFDPEQVRPTQAEEQWCRELYAWDNRLRALVDHRTLSAARAVATRWKHGELTDSTALHDLQAVLGDGRQP